MKWLVLAAAAGLVLAVPTATWWLAGDQSTTQNADPDYFLRPFRVSPALERAAGIGSVLVVVAAAVWLTWASLRHEWDLRWWSVLGALLPAGILIGLGWRVLTARVIGANIGAGCFIFFVGPVIAGLLAWAVFRSIALT